MNDTLCECGHPLSAHDTEHGDDSHCRACCAPSVACIHPFVRKNGGRMTDSEIRVLIRRAYIAGAGRFTTLRSDAADILSAADDYLLLLTLAAALPSSPPAQDRET